MTGRPVGDDVGMPVTEKSWAGGVAAALAAGGLVAVGWQLAGAVGWLRWLDDYVAGAGNIWQQDLTVLAWIVGIGTMLGGLLAVRLRPGRVWGPVTAALLGGFVVGVGLVWPVAGKITYHPEGNPVVVAGVAAVTGALAAGLLGPLSKGTLAGAAVGAVVPWPFAAVDRSWLAYTGDLRQQGAFALVAPAVCVVVPAVCAVLVGTRTGADWPAALLGATAVPVLLVVAYRLAGPNEIDHPEQTVAYSFVHAFAPVAVLVAALLAVLTARGPRVEVGRRLPVAARVLAGLAVFAVLVLTTDNFDFGPYQPFAFELTVEILVLVAALAAALVVVAAVDRTSWRSANRPAAEHRPVGGTGTVR